MIKRKVWAMKRMGGLFLLLAAGLARAQAPAVAPVPIGEEPSHHLVIANARVRIFRVEVAPHASTLLHQHDNDYFWVALGDAKIANAVRGKPEVSLAAADGSLHFARGGFAHVARNESDAPFRNVTVELLRPQTKPRNLCAQAVADEPASCPPEGMRGDRAIVPELETDQSRVGLLRLEPGERYTVNASKAPPVLIALDRTEAEARIPVEVAGGAAGEGVRPLHTADALECPEGMTIEIRNIGKVPARFLRLEFAD
jgi:hypothetical protein